MHLSLVQLQIEPGAPAENLERASDHIRSVAAAGGNLAVLPELFTVGYFAFDSYARSAESLTGETVSHLRAVADDGDIAVVAGTIVEDLAASADAGFDTPADTGYANTALFIDRTGEIRGVYRKRHLFGYDSAEQELLTPGQSLPTVEFEGFTLGMTTCYDLRFPELYRSLVEAGTTLVVVPSAWPYPRVEHWRVLPRARAIENLMYVAAANGVADFEEASLVGRSAVYDPWGTQIAGQGEEAGVLSASLDAGVVDRRREKFPALDDRR